MARRFLDRFADLWGTSGGDLNSTARGMTRYLRGRQLRIVRPVALVVPAWIPATRRVVILRRRLANADHHALWVWSGRRAASGGSPAKAGRDDRR